MGAYEFGAPSATGFITGVISNENGDPLEGALINAGNYTTFSVINGFYELEVDVGEYIISCFLEGYIIPENVEVTVYPEDTFVINFTLEPELSTNDQIFNVKKTLTNYPNPFNPSTTIKMKLAEAGKVELSIYNIKGQKVKTLLDCATTPGTYKCIWNGKDE